VVGHQVAQTFSSLDLLLIFLDSFFVVFFVVVVLVVDKTEEGEAVVAHLVPEALAPVVHRTTCTTCCCCCCAPRPRGCLSSTFKKITINSHTGRLVHSVSGETRKVNENNRGQRTKGLL